MYQSIGLLNKKAQLDVIQLRESNRFHGHSRKNWKETNNNLYYMRKKETNKTTTVRNHSERYLDFTGNSTTGRWANRIDEKPPNEFPLQHFTSQHKSRNSCPNSPEDSNWTSPRHCQQAALVQTRTSVGTSKSNLWKYNLTASHLTSFRWRRRRRRWSRWQRWIKTMAVTVGQDED